MEIITNVLNHIKRYMQCSRHSKTENMAGFSRPIDANSKQANNFLRSATKYVSKLSHKTPSLNYNYYERNVRIMCHRLPLDHLL